MTNRYIIIGDVHGCYQEAEELIREVKYDFRTDKLISVGDLVDRGPDSAKSVALFMRHRAELVEGNHENKLLRWRKKQDAYESGETRKQPDIKLGTVHKTSIDQLAAHPESEALWEYMRNSHLRYTFEVAGITYDCVHGGYLPYKGRNTPPKLIIRMRNIDDRGKLVKFDPDLPYPGTFWAELWEGPETVLFGHDPAEDVREFPYAIGLDTGCCYGGKLTALVIHEDGSKEYVSVPAKKKYFEGRDF